ncbi:heavy-metal-associated domain-containing protein [Hydrogenimonas urashimensis]|uniref:heavy-metal-associated domain-containing protein n=1 Tax=Hydrogenimonas urashimensis TaxID=2740515 RepID=UPI001915C02B|nr:heavy metal-associated domain-containing protein [Hydrogenimonas urashimensis]
MLKTYEVANIRCEGCAATIKKALSGHFGNSVVIDLSVMPRKVTVEIGDNAEEEILISSLRKLGYPQVDDEISNIESAVMKGKSFVSCAIGKFNPTKEKQ